MEWFLRTPQQYVSKPSPTLRAFYYVLGIANSQYIERAYNELVKEAGRVFPQVKLTHVKKLPLVIAEKNEQVKIADLVKRILSTKRSDPNADVSDLEFEINRHVNSLYDAKETASDAASRFSAIQEQEHLGH